ncbi:MAG: ester cyclase [Anaerolineales bacterium]
MTQDRKAFIRETIDKIYNQGRLDTIDQAYQPGFVCHQSSQKDLNGIGELKAYVRDLRQAYSDLKVSLDEVILDGDTSVVLGAIQGTNTGESVALRVPATGKKMKVPYCSVAHWQNGKVVEEFHFLDMFSVAKQLGILPARATQPS